MILKFIPFLSKATDKAFYNASSSSSSNASSEVAGGASADGILAFYKSNTNAAISIGDAVVIAKVPYLATWTFSLAGCKFEQL